MTTQSPTLPAPSWWRFVVIGTLAMGQQFPAQLMAFGLPAIFRANGLALDQLWVLSAASVPWWFKWAIAPWVDATGSARFGRRRSWIVPCTLVGALTYGTLGYLQPTLAWLWVVFAVLFAKTLVMAAQDVAVDAYAVDLLERHETTRGAAVVSACESLTYIVGYAGLLLVYDRFGWSATMALASALLLLFSAPAMFTREPARAALRPAPAPSLLRYLRRRDTPWVLGVLFPLFFAVGFIARIEGALLVDAGLTLTQIGLLSGVVASTGSLLGSVLAAAACERFGRRRVAAAGTVLVALALGAYLPMLGGSAATLAQRVPLFLAIGMLMAVLPVVFNGSRFGWSSKAQAGTDYSVQSALNQFAASLAGAAGGFVAAQLGWHALLAVSATLFLAAGSAYAALLPRIDALVRERDAAEAAEAAGVTAATPPAAPDRIRPGVPT